MWTSKRFFEIKDRSGLSWQEASLSIIFLMCFGASLYFAHWSSMEALQSIPLEKWFDQTFKIPSPTSGSTRAFIAIAQGKFLDAFLYNTATFIIIISAWLFLLSLSLSLILKKKLLFAPWFRRFMLILFFLILGVSWLVKLLWIPESYW